MKIFELYQKGIQILKDQNIASPQTDAMIFLSFVSGWDRTKIHTNSGEKVSESTIENFLNLIHKRCSHVPVQYIVGSQEFMSLTFKVNENVLIPRQDTEILVEAIISMFKFSQIPLSILEIGTGSGCIAVSLAKYLDDVNITALDISDSALSLAKINAKYHSVYHKIHFLKSNLFEALNHEKFHIIVSNPPYIPSGDILDLMSEVKNNEPLEALDGGIDGMDFYRKIISEAPNHLKPNGLIGFEIGIHQSESVKNLMLPIFDKIEIVKDLSNVPRVILGSLKNEIYYNLYD